MDNSRTPKKPAKGTIERKVRELLEEPYWLKDLKVDEVYFRTQDDCDGDLKEGIGVSIDRQGDIFVRTTQGVMSDCRFRTCGGGGRSLRVRNALLMLAEAIRLDNLEKP